MLQYGGAVQSAVLASVFSQFGDKGCVPSWPSVSDLALLGVPAFTPTVWTVRQRQQTEGLRLGAEAG